MCGIVAEHGGADPEPLERMLERLAHRGPDERGAVQINGSWLGHRRLSIVDVGGGRQPLATRDESAYLVGNGEVYNHEEVRAGLGVAVRPAAVWLVGAAGGVGGGVWGVGSCGVS